MWGEGGHLVSRNLEDRSLGKSFTQIFQPFSAMEELQSLKCICRSDLEFNREQQGKVAESVWDNEDRPWKNQKNTERKKMRAKMSWSSNMI